MTRRAWFGLGLITALAAALRFYQLDTIPPGLWYDEAWAMVRARELWTGSTLPIYFYIPGGGIHPLIIYLTRLGQLVLPHNQVIIRYVAAAAGTLAVPLTFAGLRAIFALDPTLAPRQNFLAGFGAASLALGFPPVLISRLGFEVILPAVTGAGTFWAIARWLRRPHWREASLIGLGVGLTLYTYVGARFMAIAVAVALISAGALQHRFRTALLHLSGVVVVAVIVFLPLGWFFMQHPDMFFGRAGVTTYNTLGPGARSVPLALLGNTLRTLAGLSIPGFGDQLPRHNLPGQPYFDAFLSLAFWLGALDLVRHPRRLSSALLLSWVILTLIPVILTDNPPGFTRVIGGSPALAGVVALGALTIDRALAPRAPRLAISFLGVGLLFSAAFTTYRYFGIWAVDPRLHDAFQLGDWEAAQFARARVAQGAVYVMPDLITDAHPTFSWLLGGSAVRSLSQAECVAYPATAAQPTTYIIDALNEPGPSFAQALRTAYPGAQEAPPILHRPEAFPLYFVYTVPAGARRQPPAVPELARFGDMLQLDGYSLSPGPLHPGATLTVTLEWSVQQPTATDYTVFLHLHPVNDPASAPVAQSDGRPCGGTYLMPAWTTGEVIADAHPLDLPSSLPAGDYELVVGLYDLATGTRVPVTAAANGSADQLPLGHIHLEP